MTEKDLSITAEADLGYGQILAILLRRRFLFLGVLASVVAAAAVSTLFKSPTYISSMQLLVEPNYQGKQDAGEQSAFSASEPSQTDYATQINLMRSYQFIKEAAETLQSEYPELTPGEIQSSFTLSQVVEDKVNTKIFEATYITNDPVKAQKVLSTLQDIYQAYNLEQQNLRLNKGVKLIDSQLQTALENVTKTQQQLEQFRKERNLIDPNQQATALTTALNQVEQEQRATLTQYQDMQARFNTLQQQLNLSPQSALVASRLSQSSRYQTLLNELQKTDLDLGQQRVTFTDADPRIEDLVDQRQSKLELLRKEVAQILGDMPVNIDTSGENLLSEGQLSAVDLNLVGSMVEAQVNLASLSAREKSLIESRQQLRNQLNQFPGLIAEYDRLQPEVEIGRSVVEKLLEQQQETSARLSRGGFNWQVVEAPLIGAQTGPNQKQDLLLGIVAGVFLGGVAAFAREAIDGVVHTSDELKQQVAMPLLGIVPELPSPELDKSFISLPFRKVEASILPVAKSLNWLPFRDAVDLIYKNIQLLNPNAPLKSLTITSAVAGEGKSTLILGLALSAARTNQRVLVIDADLRRPALHEHLNLPNEQGLSRILTDRSVSLKPNRVSLSGLRIDVLTAGSESPDPVKLLSSKRMKDLITMFTSRYDLVLIDTPPVLGMVDAVQVASLCNGSILVGRLDRVTQADLTQAVERLSKLNLIGIVANGSRSHSTPYTPEINRSGLLLAREFESIQNN